MRYWIAGILITLIASPATAKIAPHWQDLPPLPTPRQEVAVAALGSEIFVIGGITENRQSSAVVEVYEVETREWKLAPPLPDPVHHAGAVVVAGRVYKVGGLDASFRGVSSVSCLDPDGDTWRRVSDLPWPRGAMGVATLDGRIYAAGGQNGSSSFSNFAAYDPMIDEWIELPAMPTARNHLAAVAHEGRFYAVGGRAGGLSGAFEAFNPETRTWMRLTDLPTPRAGIAAAVYDDFVFVIGGEGNSDHPFGVFPHVESYDLRFDRWQRNIDMEHPRHGMGAAAVDDGIIVPGGSPVQGFGVTNTSDLWLPGGRPRGVFLRGNANVDASVDLSDAIAILIYLFLDTSPLLCEDAADADDSGFLDITDPIFVLSYLFLGGSPPPSPGPRQPGRDPTNDSLDCATSIFP